MSGFSYVPFSRGHICKGHIFQRSIFSGVRSSGFRFVYGQFFWGQIWLVGFFRGLVVQGPGYTWVRFISVQVFRCQYFQVSGFSGVPFSRGHIFQGSNFCRGQVFKE